eukprot:gene17962-5670_t
MIGESNNDGLIRGHEKWYSADPYEIVRLETGQLTVLCRSGTLNCPVKPRHEILYGLWFFIEGNVYDATEFADEHPGGVDPLLENTGADATASFQAVPHSKAAVAMLEKYYIGDLEGTLEPAQSTEEPLPEYQPKISPQAA